VSNKILAIYYSQSGQLKEILDQFLLPFSENSIEIEYLKVEPEVEFSFPWTAKSFFEAMPESVLVKPVPLKPFNLLSEKYNLVIFAYQPWFLSPSIPANSILQHADFIRIMKDTPVITLIGSRNMWINGQEKVKKLLQRCEARLVGNVVLTDRHNNFASAVSILHWMLSGKKEKYLGIFPIPGVSIEDIQNTRRHGQSAYEHFKSGDYSSLQQQFIDNKAVEIKSNLMFIEGRAGKLFSIWANFINRRKNRSFWLIIFKYYLLFALFIVAPIVLLINIILFKPFLQKHIQRKKAFYLGVKYS